MILWRSLFDALRVPWKDRGPNCSSGRVNISCPWCGDQDPSFHLSIDESTSAYFCMRTPGSHHSGRSVPWLLLGLKVHPTEIDALVAQHSDEHPPPRLTTSRVQVLDWDKFESAADHEAPLDYLRQRGYASAEGLARRYDLRFTRVGRHAWRVLMPLTCPQDGYRVTAFTGRTIRDQTPRYLINDPSGASLYLPTDLGMGRVCVAALQGTALTQEKRLHLSMLAGRHDALVMCEGPFDALTLVASRSPLLAALRGAYYVPDSDQSDSDTYRLIHELEMSLRMPGRDIPHMPRVTRLQLPPYYKDLGEFADDPSEVTRWLQHALS